MRCDIDICVGQEKVRHGQRPQSGDIYKNKPMNMKELKSL